MAGTVQGPFSAASQPALQAVLDELIRVEGLRPEPQKSASQTQQDVQNLLRAWAEGDSSALGPHGAQLIASLHSGPGIRAALTSLQAQSFPLFDGTGKLGRYLGVISQALGQGGTCIPAGILFAEYPTHRFNACVVSTAHGDLCLMNAGLLKLLYHVSVAANHAYEDDGRLGAIDSAAVKVATALVISVVAQYLGARAHVHVQAIGRQLPPEGLYDATALAYSMRLFVLAHEIGHVALGHTQIEDEQTVVCVLAETAVISREREDEFAADRFAQDVLLSIDRQGLFAEPVAAGGLAFLMVHAIVQEVQATLGQATEATVASAESHPPTMERIKALDASLGAAYGDGSREASGPCVVLQRILMAIQHTEIAPAGDSVELRPRVA